jgi:hypothetical protein
LRRDRADARDGADRRGARAGSALAVLLGILLAVALVEVALRAYSRLVPNADVEFVRYARLMKRSAAGSPTSFRHAPNTRARLMGVDVATDARGFRDVPHAPAPGLVRVGLLGDSVTFGWGVRYGERFSELLEERWTERLGRPVELLNTGHGNYNGVQELAILEEALAGEDLAGILQVWYINDAEPTPPHRELPWWGRLHAAVFLWSKSDLVRRRLGARADYVEYYRGLYREGAEGRAAFEASLAGVGRWSRRRGLPWILVVLPEFHGFAGGGPFDDVYRWVAERARGQGAIVVDATGAFRDADPATIRVAYNDVHPNARGHAIIADAIDRAVDPATFPPRAPAAAGPEVPSR